MPIKKENRHFYEGPEWKKIRTEILDRAQNKCEWCFRPNRQVAYVMADGWINPEEGLFFDWNGAACRYIRMSEWPEGRLVETVLTIAHLDHNPANNSPENLRALCQRCHNNYDVPHRKANARATRDHKLGLSLFGE